MKLAKILYEFENPEMNSVVEGILLESYKDLELFQKEIKKSEESVLLKFVKSKESPDRFGHIVNGFRPLEKSIARYAIHKGMMNESNPIYELGVSSNKVYTSAYKVFENYGSLFLNKSGGFCNVTDNMRILKTEEISFFPNPPKYYIGKNSKVINLENDFELEEDSVKYMTKNFGNNFSYIIDMKTYDEKDFEKVFTEFKNQGGETVYVYTTGMDFEQMYVYSKSAFKCGLTKFIFDFNAGLDENINKFINWLTERAEVEILNLVELTKRPISK